MDLSSPREEQRCENCRVWVEGQCRRDPPRHQLLPGKGQGTMQLAGVWPPAEAEKWCGRWQRRRSASEEEQLQKGCPQGAPSDANLGSERPEEEGGGGE